MSEGVVYKSFNGGYAFTSENVDKYVLEGMSGVYLLSEGDRDADRNLYVSYVGRAVKSASEDLRKRLHDHLNAEDEKLINVDGTEECMYKYFWFEYVETALGAYEEECVNYHKSLASHS